MRIIPIATRGKIASQVMTARTWTDGGAGGAVGTDSVVAGVELVPVSPRVLLMVCLHSFQLNGCN